MDTKVRHRMLEKPTRFRVKENVRQVRNGIDPADLGWVFGTVVIDGQEWALVQFDAGEDPELFKADFIEVETTIYKPLDKIT